jgi:hypothetical protein
VVDAWDGRGPTPSLSNASVLITGGVSGLGSPLSPPSPPQVPSFLWCPSLSGVSIFPVPEPFWCQHFSGVSTFLVSALF